MSTNEILEYRPNKNLAFHIQSVIVNLYIVI